MPGLNSNWSKYGCEKCNTYKLLILSVNFSNSKSSFQGWIDQNNATHPCVAKEDGGTEFKNALNNGNVGGPKYLIKPDKTFKKNPSSSEIDNAGGNEQHVCGNDQQAPTVSVNSPGNSDVLMAGIEQEITWTATDNFGVVAKAIYFSSDNGSNWSLVDSSTDNTGSYTWTVPDEVSTECKIKIFAYDAAGNVGKSESEVFEIETATNIIYHSEMVSNLIKFKNTPESFMVYLPFSGNYTVTISDVHGRKLSSFITSGNKQWHNITKPLSSGMHILSIRNSGKIIDKKIWFVR